MVTKKYPTRMRGKSKERKFYLPLGEENFLVGLKITGCNFQTLNLKLINLLADFAD